MSEQPPNEPPASGSDPYGNPPGNPYGNPPPPPATNPYAAPPPSAAPPPAQPPYPGSPPAAPPPAAPPPAGPPPGYPAPTYGGYGGQPAPQRGAGGLAIAALVVAIAAGVLFWIPFLGVVLALVGLVLGVIAWATAGKNGRPKGMAVAATIVSILAMIGALAVTAFILFFGDVILDCSDPNLTEEEVNQCIEDGFNDRLGIDEP